MATTLKAFREDGTEVRPGDTVTQPGCAPMTFRAATAASGNPGEGSGIITVEQNGRNCPDMYAGPFGLTVREVTSSQPEPAWESSMTDEPGDIQRDIRGPGGFWALVGPNSSLMWDWSIVDASDGATIASGDEDTQDDARQAVANWEREHGLIPEDASPGKVVPDLAGLVSTLSPASSGQPERSALDEALAAVDNAQYGDDWDTSTELAALRDLASAVRAETRPDPERAAAMAAEAEQAARTTAPPVPGITRNSGKTVYAVLGHQPAVPGSLESWIVAAASDDGEHVTWNAYASDDGSARLSYGGGHYHSPGEGAGFEALVDLAERAGVFRRLTGLSSGPVTREAFRESHAKVLDELNGIYGVGKARVRAGLLEAAALGYARISWHSGDGRHDYGIRYDRVRCTFSWIAERTVQ